MARIFHYFIILRWIPCQVSTSVLCLHYRDSTLQYKRSVHFGNKFPCIITLQLYIQYTLLVCLFESNNVRDDFVCERWSLFQATTSVLCLHYHPETVHCSTKDAYTSEITFLAVMGVWIDEGWRGSNRSLDLRRGSLRCGSLD